MIIGQFDSASLHYPFPPHPHYITPNRTQIDDGLIAFSIGPFCERADSFYIPSRQGPTLRVGRYMGYSYMDINIKFQDHSVMYNAAEVQFRRANKGFRLKCKP